MHLVIKSEKMNAYWYLMHLDCFRETCIDSFGLENLQFSARVQQLQNGGGIKESQFFGDEEIARMSANNRGYSLNPFSDFNESLIKSLWQNNANHWEIEFYVSVISHIEAIAFCFYSYAPAIEIRSQTLGSPAKENLIDIAAEMTTEAISNASFVSFGAGSIAWQRALQSKSINKPINDKFFNCLRC